MSRFGIPKRNGISLGSCMSVGMRNGAQPSPVNPLKSAALFSIFGDSVTVAAPSSANLFVGGNAPAIIGQVIGSEQHFNDSVSIQAGLDIASAIAYYKALTPTAILVGDLVGQTLFPAVYSAPATIGNTGVVIFDAQGNVNAKFVILAGAVTIASSTIST